MTRMLKRLLVGAYAVLAGLVLAFGTMEAASVVGDPCDDEESGLVGSCPPLDEETCPEECDRIFGTTGQCVQMGPNTCCQCTT